MRKGSRQFDPRVKINRLRSSGDTFVAPGNVSVETVMESCGSRCAGPCCASAGKLDNNNGNAASRKRWRETDIRNGKSSGGVAEKQDVRKTGRYSKWCSGPCLQRARPSRS